jgi:hypothetical protein
MRRGFPYETSITSKKEGEISVESRILRSVTMSRDIDCARYVRHITHDKIARAIPRTAVSVLLVTFQ